MAALYIPGFDASTALGGRILAILAVACRFLSVYRFLKFHGKLAVTYSVEEDKNR